MSKKKDDKRAVLVSLDLTKSGIVRLNLDDVLQENSTTWKNSALFTFNNYDENTFDILEFDDKELAEIGFNVVARLHVFRKLGEA
jgi:hypothetical protein